MLFRKDLLVLVPVMLMALPATAWAFGGAAGCADLPDYERAVGVMEGIPSGCDMSVEQARRILAQHDAASGQAVIGQGVVGQPPTPHARRKHHRTQPPPT